MQTDRRKICRGRLSGLVPPASAEPLADALSNVLRTPVEELTKMGLAGRAKVLRDHNAATEAEKLAELFQKAGKEEEGARARAREDMAELAWCVARVAECDGACPEGEAVTRSVPAEEL